MKSLMVLILISVASFCKPTTGSTDKSKQALFPLALLGSLSMGSEFDIPYATCEGAKEFTKESGIVTDETPANTIKYFKFNSTKTESLYFNVNSSTGNSSGSFCLFGFAQNQTVDNNSSMDTLETSSDYCVSGFSLTTTASSYRCIAVLALSSGGKFDLKTSINGSGSTTTNSTLRPDLSNPTVLTEGQTKNESFTEYASYPAFKAADNTGGGKFFKFTIPANKTALVNLFNLSNSSRAGIGVYKVADNTLLGSFDIDTNYSNNRSVTFTAGATTEDVLFYVGSGNKGVSYSINFTIQGKIETKSFISAGLNSPSGLAIDTSGNIYVTETNGYKVKKFDSNGGLLWSLGSSSGDVIGNSSVVKFNSPTGIAVDSTGNVYITDNYVDKIKMIDPTGTTTSLIAGSSYGDDGATIDVPGASAKFRRPIGIAVDDTYIYVADSYNYSIRRIKKSDNKVSLFAGSGTPVSGTTDGIGGDARFSSPRALTIASGYLYLADGNYIRKINLTTAEVSTVTSKTGGWPYENGDTSSIRVSSAQTIAADSSGNLYVTANYSVYKLIPAGKTFFYAGSGGYSSGDLLGFGVSSRFNFYGFAGLAFDATGNLYIADISNAKIKKIVYSP